MYIPCHMLFKKFTKSCVFQPGRVVTLVVSEDPEVRIGGWEAGKVLTTIGLKHMFHNIPSLHCSTSFSLSFLPVCVFLMVPSPLGPPWLASLPNSFQSYKCAFSLSYPSVSKPHCILLSFSYCLTHLFLISGHYGFLSPLFSIQALFHSPPLPKII